MLIFYFLFFLPSASTAVYEFTNNTKIIELLVKIFFKKYISRLYSTCKQVKIDFSHKIYKYFTLLAKSIMFAFHLVGNKGGYCRKCYY